MKKYIALLLALMMTLCLFAGCGDTASDENTGEPTTDVADEVDEPSDEMPSEEPSDEMPSGEMPSGEMPSGEAGAPAGGEPMADTSTFDELTLEDGTVVTNVTMSYTDSGDSSEIRTFSVTCTLNGQELTFNGAIDKGQFTADSGDEVEQAVVTAIQEAQSAMGIGGDKGDGMPSGDKDKDSGMPSAS